MYKKVLLLWELKWERSISNQNYATTIERDTRLTIRSHKNAAHRTKQALARLLGTSARCCVEIISRWTKLETRTSKVKENGTVYINRPEMRHCDWSSWSQLFEWRTKHVPCSAVFCSTDYSLPCRRTRHRELPNDRFIALDRYTKGENVFLRWRSKLSWISGVKRLREELLNELDHLGNLLQDRSREEAIKWAVRPRCYSVISTVGGIFQVYLHENFLYFEQSWLSTASHRRTSLERFLNSSVHVAFEKFEAKLVRNRNKRSTPAAWLNCKWRSTGILSVNM